MREQLACAFVSAPCAPRWLRGRAARFVGLYALAAGAVLGLVATVVLLGRDDLRALAFSYLFPPDWHAVVGWLFDRYVADQARPVLVNALLSGAMVVVSATLFPLKEKVAGVFDDEAGLTGRPAAELPLWMQGFEEAKLVVLYATAQLTIFWIGYPPDPERRAAATALSYAWLFATYAVDFISPVIQRHGLRYTVILRALAVRPVLAFGFGAVFALPPLLTAEVLATRPDLSLEVAVLILFSVHLASLVWAVVGGAVAGAALLPVASRTRAPWMGLRVLGWAGAVALLALDLWLLGVVARSIHHKSQILKCDWRVDWRSAEFERPRLGSLLLGNVDVGVRLDVEVHNPTPFDVVVEDNRVEVHHDGAPVVTSRLEPMKIAAGETARQKLGLRWRIDAESLKKGRDLFTDRWSAVLFVEVAEDFDFPIYLRTLP